MKKLIFAAVALGAVLLGACSRETAVDGKSGKGSKKLTVKVNVQGIGTDVATRGTIAPETGEDQLGSLYLLFFNPDPYMGGQFIDYVEVAGPLTMNTSIPIDLSAHPLLSISAAYDVLAVGNVTDNTYLGETVTAWMNEQNGKTESQVMSSAIAWVQGSTTNDANAVAPSALLMNGRVVKATDQFDLTFTMVRNMVRFDVYSASSVSSAYDLVSASIWNAYPESSIFGNAILDYSNSTSRITRYYGVSNAANTTGVAGADGNGDILGNIVGGLYCFENQVITPTQNDQETTCLIVGLKDRAAGTITYYRANIAPDQSPQFIKHNNVYRLTINNVNGPGFSDEATAYAGQGNNLDYNINNWDLDNNGLIVMDQNSMLAIPTKNINIGADGGQSSYSIYTSSTTPGQVLTIQSQTWDPANGGITASLSGNTLNISATPLGLGETQRTGVIVLSFAGLQASISVLQSPSVSTYLNVTLPDGGIPRFAPYAGIPSGLVTVKASGPWHAQLYMDGFSFSPAVSPTTAITTIASTDGYVTNNQFRIYTWDNNPDPTLREAFVVVSLDSDPVNYASVVRISQAPAGGIAVTPTQTAVTFNGMGTGLANIAGNATNTFNVLPSMMDDPANPGNQIISPWTATIIPTGANNDTAFFTITTQTYDANNSANNVVTVNAVGVNASGRSYQAILHVVLNSDPSKYTDIQLIQQSASVDTSPNTFSAIPTNGGTTPAITVNADASLQWSAAITTTSGTSTDGRVLVNHAATLVNAADNSPIVAGTNYPMGTQFKVVFPKVYYPNREIPSLAATVTVSVGGMQKILTVSQTSLIARNMIGFGMNGAPTYGNLGDIYNAGWDGTNNGGYAPAAGTGLASIPGYTRYSPNGSSATTALPSGTAYLHVVPHGYGAAYSWSVVDNFIDSDNGWTVLSCQDNSGLPPMNNANSPLQRNGAGYQPIVYGAGGNGSYSTASSATKLYQFIMQQPKGTATLPLGTATNFYTDGVSTYLPQPWPSSAVVFLTRTGNANQALLVVDIKNGFLYMGDSQLFWYNTYLTTGGNPDDRYYLLDNLMYFIGNASKYGSNFTDMLRDDLSVPAPWDPIWGANAGVPSK